MSELLTAAAKPVHPADDIEPTPQAEVVLEPASPIAEIEVPPAPTLITEQEVVSQHCGRGAGKPWVDGSRGVHAPNLRDMIGGFK